MSKCVGSSVPGNIARLEEEGLIGVGNTTDGLVRLTGGFGLFLSSDVVRVELPAVLE